MSILPLHPPTIEDQVTGSAADAGVQAPAKPAGAPLPALLLSDAQCASMCGCSRRTFRTWDARQLVPRSLKIAGSRRWRRADIDLWIEWGGPARAEFEAKKAAEASVKKGARR